ncbi:7-carboxy-7-deazaguanine synthase QueE [Methanothermococcus okinawensis]|uniref:7-carboxy-7-deazaguanine synthase n=1 Tax=Methanothermococcus okinawensis (strain DSM 14208 / JCM 11175 / IH1) TaxID=647113 RepID=F8AKP4_METOI|nr:7-carboxy-7-deazaguanine synthase QueE [Methanothermococcus okinawensis]AEH06377.1 Radical SAM domain protein [Methanothermococcus okinawensis IH1]
MISEIFSSIMGEGKFIGRRYIFVRFKGCPLNCIYCDEHVKDNLICRVEEIPGSGEFKEYDDINDNDKLIDVINKLKTPDLFAISFTGGEPLLYADKIKEYSKILHNLGYKTHLESNGMYPDRITFFDYASIDIKLLEHFVNMDIETYTKLYKNELKSIKKLYDLGSDVYAKVVIMGNTNPKVVENIAKDLSDIGDIMLCIQPVSSCLNIKTTPTNKKLLDIMELCGAHLKDNVICTSQMHKYLGML